MTPERWFAEVAPGQRWFADKGRVVEGAGIAWSHLPAEDAGFELHVADIRFVDGTSSRYVAALDREHRRDVTTEPAFTRFLLESLIDPGVVPRGLTWERLGPVPFAASPGPGKDLGVQQSNTSIRFDGDLLVKLNRRLAAGISPEVELSAVMQRSADRSSTTTTYGALWLELPGESPACLAIASQFVPNQGDGWSTMLKQLRRVRTSRDMGESIAEVGVIAKLTAAMHRALTADPWREAVAPEIVGDAVVAAWNEAANRELDDLLADFARSQPSLPPEQASLVDLVPAAVPQLRARLSVFNVLRGTHRIRIHGDYHLGQVLRTHDGSYVAIDFDGEPERPLSERRQKYSALRDVAGMLRSFAYARGTVEMERRQAGDEITVLREWESAARDTFMTTYIAGLSSQPYALLPASSEDIRQALAALELEKAIYECRYEINNRPDWLWLPLTRLVHET